MTAAFNAFMNVVFDVLCFPFTAMPPVIGLSVLSAVFGVVLLLLFKHTSPQDMIGKVKERLWGSLHEIRLFQDQLGVLTKAILRLFRDNFVYISCCLVALVPMILIVMPILFQLDARYGFAPLEPGDKVVLNVTLGEGQNPVEDEVALELPDALVLEAGPVRVKETRELIYRLRVEEAGAHELAIAVNGERFTERVDADHELKTISPSRFSSAKTFDALMFPVEKPWPKDAAVQAATITHARAPMVGIDGNLFPWLIIFCVVGLLFGYAMKGVFKVNL